MKSKAAREEREIRQYHLERERRRLNEALDAIEREHGRPISDYARASAVRGLDAGLSVETNVAGFTRTASTGRTEPASPPDAESEPAAPEPEIPVQDGGLCGALDLVPREMIGHLAPD
jgi:hypothetical protein